MAKYVTNDVVVLLPGIIGSVLARNGKEVWAPSAGALMRALTSGGESILGLRMQGDDPTLDDLGDGVTATRLAPDVTIVPGFWKIDGYGKVSDSIREAFGLELGKNMFEFPYDWRRDIRVAARKLQRESHTWLTNWRARGSKDARLILVAHSMGGLVSRYFLEVLGGWESTRALITFGTPYGGSLNALNFLTNGYNKSIGPLSLDLSPVLSSLTSVYQLLPNYPCVDSGPGKLQLVKEVPALPKVDNNRAIAAFDFHEKIREAQASNRSIPAYQEHGYRTFPILGIEQPTFQSARFRKGKVDILREIGGVDESGDGTVPRISAVPLELIKEQRDVYAAEMHGSLQNNDAVLTQVCGIISAMDLPQRRRAGPPTSLSLYLDDAYSTNEPLKISVRASEARPRLRASVVDAQTGREVADAPLRVQGDKQTIELDPLSAGLYRVTVSGDPKRVSPVNDVFVVAGADESAFASGRGGGSASSRTGRRTASLTMDPGISDSKPDSVVLGGRPARPVGQQAVDQKLAGTSRITRKVRAKRPAEVIPASKAIAAEHDEGTSPMRFPSIQLDGPVQAGQPISISVDLLLEDIDRDTQAPGGVRIENLAADWQEIEVLVELQCAAIRFDSPVASVTVKRNAPSIPARFRGTVAADAGRDPFDTFAVFSHGGRVCGLARRRLSPTSGPSEQRPATPAEPGVVVDRQAEAPALTVKILRLKESAPGQLTWTLSVAPGLAIPRMPGKLFDTIDLGRHTRDYAEQLLARCAEMLPGEHVDKFRGIGEDLWKRAPNCFHLAYWAMRDALGPEFPIQLVTNDPFVPWELMRPYRDDESESAEILALAHPIARWIADFEGSLHQPIPHGRIVTIAPKYSRKSDELKRAQDEAKLLTKRFHAQPIEGKYAAVSRLLREGLKPEVVSVLHFAGHGEFRAELAGASNIKLEDQSLSADQVGTQETRLGVTDGPLVVFNACEVGAAGAALGAAGGWAETLSRRGFRGFIAPLWAVEDDGASVVVEDLFKAIIERHERIGVAMRDIRKHHGPNSPTFFAYLYYGDVMARIG